MTFPDSFTAFGKTYVPRVEGVLPSEFTFIRVLHELEVPSHRRTTPPDRPEVRQLDPPNLFVPFGKSWQMKAWSMNPLLTANNMTAVYHYRLFIANNNGFGDDNDPRANHFTAEDLSSPVLKVEALTCGGNVHRVLGEAAISRGGQSIPSYILEVLDYRTPPPESIPPWLVVWAVNMGTDGTPRRFQQGVQSNGFVPGVRHPFVSDPSKIITVPKWRCVRWVESEPPDPYRIYLPV